MALTGTSSFLRRAVVVVLAVWAVGLFFMEALQQVGAWAAALLAVVLVIRKELRLEPDVRAYVRATLALVAWQIISPAVALLTGTAEHWPRSGRYFQIIDTASGATVASIGTVGVPWLLIGGLVAGGWLAASALGLFQHFVLWTWEPPAFLKLNMSRLQENFGTDVEPRYAAGGFLFHRLRFSHAAVAVLGPALAVLARGRVVWRRALAGALVCALLLCPYAAFARAALLAGFAVCVLALLLLSHGTPRKVGLGVAALLAVMVAVTPSWRERMGKAAGNLFGGERTLAMSVGWRLVKAHPVLGVGFGNHKPAALATQAETGITDLLATDSHNLWLTTWAETGLVGLVLLASVHLLLARALVRRHREGSLAATGALLSFGGFHILSLVHYLPFHTSVYLCFSFIWGLGLCRGSEVLGLPPDEVRGKPSGA